MNPKPGWIFALLPRFDKPPGGADGDDTLGGTAHIGDDEADARNKLGI
jgi:hypothetical protein